jgi:cyclase
MKREMFYGADALIFANAKVLRGKMTNEENIFWLRLKEHFSNYKFRRQHPISIYIVDFYCHKLKLVIEIDGSIHDLEDVKRNDIKRQRDLENLKLTVLRFTNNQIKLEIEKVINEISEFINKSNQFI